MKHKFILLLIFFAAVSCTSFDDSEIWDKFREHEERIEALEALCNKMNSNISALQTILEALQKNDYITDVAKIMENGVEVGYITPQFRVEEGEWYISYDNGRVRYDCDILVSFQGVSWH